MNTEINNPIYHPLLASSELNGGGQSLDETRAVWKHLQSLNPEVKAFLMSTNIPDALRTLQVNNNLSDAQIEGVSVAIRWYKMTEISESTFKELFLDICDTQELAEKIYPQIQGILRLPVILEEEEKDESDSIEKVSTKVSLAVLQALSQYSNLGNQMISQERIRIKSQPEPVRGSLFNWIKCYRDELGIGQHSTVERGQFLFRSENGKKLTPEERERVNLILKSIEENYALDIDAEKQVIIFPEVHFEKSSTHPSIAAGIDTDSSKVDESKFGTTPQAVPTSFFAPRAVSQKTSGEQLVVEKKQAAVSPYEKVIISHQFFPEEKVLQPSVDFNSEAEKLKREPKPEWIKGSFTNESIPEKVKAEEVNGVMSFSLNHVLPVEQKEEKEVSTDNVTAPQKEQKKGSTSITQAQSRKSQFHIRPVSR